MTRLGTVWVGVLLVPVNYHVATFCLWLGHWFSHLPGSPLRKHHVLSHHRLYPDSSRCRTPSFRFASGAYDSNKALLPWLLPPAIVYLLALPAALGVVSCLELAVATGVVAWLHVQFHLTRSPLDRWRWFETARARHVVHHDRDVNFAVGDHFWDRLFGSFAEAPGPGPRRGGRPADQSGIASRVSVRPLSQTTTRSRNRSAPSSSTSASR